MKTLKFDKDYLRNMYGDCDEDIAGIISEFMTEYESMDRELTLAFEQNDVQKLMQLLHKNSSGFTYIGFAEISEEMKKLYQKCSAITNLSSISEDFNSLKEMLAACMKVCHTEIAKMK